MSGSNLGVALAGWQAPLGIELGVDGFSALMLGLTGVLTTVITIYSVFYFANSRAREKFWPLWWLLNLGVVALLMANDIFNMFVTLEIISLAAVALVAITDNSQAIRAALRYLLVGLLGSLCYLLAVALLYIDYGTLDIKLLQQQVVANGISWAALALITAGLMLKTALVPMHFWLPAAHSSAPAPVSAILSALIVKTSFYLLARFWFDILSIAVSPAGLTLLGMFASVAIFWGLYQALRAKRLKLLVAYSTVAQIGYLFLLFPLLLPTLGANDSTSIEIRQAALTATAYFIIAHAIAKAAMFMAAGNIIKALGHDEISRLAGSVRYIPMSLMIFAIAGISLIGLPPSAGFIAKWLMLNVSIDTGQWWWVIVLLGGGLMAAMVMFKILDCAFSQPEGKRLGTGGTIHNQGIPFAMSLCGLSLAVLAIGLGFNAEILVNLMASGGKL